MMQRLPRCGFGHWSRVAMWIEELQAAKKEAAVKRAPEVLMRKVPDQGRKMENAGAI